MRETKVSSTIQVSSLAHWERFLCPFVSARDRASNGISKATISPRNGAREEKGTRRADRGEGKFDKFEREGGGEK